MQRIIPAVLVAIAAGIVVVSAADVGETSLPGGTWASIA